MRTFKNRSAASCKARRVSLAAAVLIASAGAVAANDHRSAHANRYYGLHEHRSVRVDAPLIYRANVDPSGTRGREDLGQSPLYPEGPGNVED
jgi:hypothetical protein